MRTHKTWAIWLPVILLLVTMSATWACEGCANLEAISTGQSVKGVEAGFSWSVLFLLFMPFALFGWLFSIMVKACNALDARTAARAASPTQAPAREG